MYVMGIIMVVVVSFEGPVVGARDRYIYRALQGGRVLQQGGRKVQVPKHALLRYKSKMYFPKETGRKIKELVCFSLRYPHE